ncbi:MAG: hypothetical protein LC795_15295 [Acidobacteria bacterium]|nr:hypothetical protein [Acidobacteriota bacterium]MCA1620641.1 hypothetical protein [Acidobacteriota bacterium]
MLKGQTTIGRFSARCPPGTEPIVARLRLARLFGGAELAPHGFPPRAVLVIRSLKSEHGVPLGGRLLLRPDSEREMREQVSRLWRGAARPVCGRVPARAEAVLFEDEGEWLASLGLAATRGEAAAHWCFRAALGAETAAATRATLVRVWCESPRFMPAALVRLARWGEAARFLGALGDEGAGALLFALRSEFALPRGAPSPRPRDATFETTRRGETRPNTPVGGRRAAPPADGRVVGRDGRRDGRAEDVQASEASPAPWRRWLASAGGECERLPPAAQRLLAYAAALFHAPALARRADFAEEVRAFTERAAPRRRPEPAAARDDTPLPRARGDTGSDARETAGASESAAPTRERGKRAAVVGDEHESTARPSRVKPDARDEEPAARATAGTNLTEPPDEVAPAELIDEGAAEALEPASPWANLGGCETRLGGALFLLNLIRGLRLPECFDEDYQLSEHITGWGLAELLARALLGRGCAEFEDDPLWGALAQLDGRAHGEPPAQGLRVGDTYRAPARWLNLFPPRDGEGGASPSPDLGHVETFEGVRAYGGAPLPADLRRWMTWTFPFLSYALRRSLAEAGEEGADTEAVRELLVRRGRLYCTATHVVVVLEASSVSFAARRSGLDASPGWVRDLMRVVAFHYE